jgi:hypothetical protein
MGNCCILMCVFNFCGLIYNKIEICNGIQQFPIEMAMIQCTADAETWYNATYRQ